MVTYLASQRQALLQQSAPGRRLALRERGAAQGAESVARPNELALGPCQAQRFLGAGPCRRMIGLQFGKYCEIAEADSLAHAIASRTGGDHRFLGMPLRDRVLTAGLRPPVRNR